MASFPLLIRKLFSGTDDAVCLPRLDLSSESEATKKLYGMHEEITEKFGATAYRQNDRRSVDGSNGSRSSGSDSRSLRREIGRTSFNEKGKGETTIRGDLRCGSPAAGRSGIDRHAHVHDIHATMLHLMGLNHIISRTCTMAALSGPRLYQAM